MTKDLFYAPYYNREFFAYLSRDGQKSFWADLWCKVPTKEGTKHITVSEYMPSSNLNLPVSDLRNLPYGIIDAHNHLDGYSPSSVLAMMDRARVESIMNLSIFAERDSFLEEFRRQKAAFGDRLFSAATLPWSRISQPGTVGRLCDWIEEYRCLGVNAIKVYKEFGLRLRDDFGSGELLRLDDERFAPVWELCGQLDMPVYVHQGDPVAFFRPLDATNERLEELGAHPDWHFHEADTSIPTREDVLTRLQSVIRRHPRTVFVSVHVGNDVENLGSVQRLLDEHPNMWVDLSARISELGRQPHAAHAFLSRYCHRVIFGSDLPPHPEMYARYRRFLETADDNFMYPTHVSGQGNWRVSGVALGPHAVRRIYRDNFSELLSNSHRDLIERNRKKPYHEGWNCCEST